MSILTPLETLYDAATGDELSLPEELAALYGRFRLPSRADRPYIVGNFVTTLDGVVSLGIPGQSGGGPISGFNAHDRMVMGLLRAIADAVIVGAGTLRAVSPKHVWTAPYIFPPLAGAFQQLREQLGKPEPPLNVIVTAQGAIDLGRGVFQAGDVPVLIVTTKTGASRIRRSSLPPSVRVVALGDDVTLSVSSILEAVRDECPGQCYLTEGGPQLIGDFFAERCLDELFLTLAPQVAGRDGVIERPGLVAGRSFAPDDPLWGMLSGIKRSGSHLFLRFRFGGAK